MYCWLHIGVTQKEIYNCTFKIFHSNNSSHLSAVYIRIHNLLEDIYHYTNIHLSDLLFLWHLSSLHPLSDQFPREIKVLCVLYGLVHASVIIDKFLFNPLRTMLIFQIKVNVHNVKMHLLWIFFFFALTLWSIRDEKFWRA